MRVSLSVDGVHVSCTRRGLFRLVAVKDPGVVGFVPSTRTVADAMDALSAPSRSLTWTVRSPSPEASGHALVPRNVSSADHVAPPSFEKATSMGAHASLACIDRLT